MQTMLFRVRGIVQGVGFRYWTQRMATHLNVTGWVRNMPDGSVQAQATGTQSQLEEFSKQLWTGPQYSSVTAIDIEKNDTMLSDSMDNLTESPLQISPVNQNEQTSQNSFSIRY